MDFKHIEALLDKYWEGQSTEAEEQALRNALKSPGLPSQLQEAASMFAYFDNQAENIRLNQDFDAKVLKQIKKEETSSIKTDWTFYLRIAASVVVVIAIGVMALLNPQLPAFREEGESDPQKAYEETKKALMFLSLKMNEGTAKVQEKIETFAIAQEQIHQ